MGWLRLHVRDEDGPVAIREVTRAAVGDRHLGAAGARRGGGVQRRRCLGSGVPVPHGARRSGSARRCWRSASRTSASSDSSCTPRRADAVQVWDRLAAAGARARPRDRAGTGRWRALRHGEGLPLHGQRPDGRRHALRGRARFLRGAGQGRVHRRARRCAAAGTEPSRRIRTLLVGGEEYLPATAARRCWWTAATAGRVRSLPTGTPSGRTIAFAYLPADLADDARVEVEVLGRPVAAELAADVLVDPAHARVRA